jgi:pyruvate dehydrogenase E1 component
VSLGTDGFGLSDTRPALRRHFRVDAESIVVRVLGELAKRGQIERSVVAQAVEKYQITDPAKAPVDLTQDTPAT